MSSQFRQKPPRDIVVVGGSSAGLFAAVLLKRQGHTVRILEKAISSEREGQAAGIGFSGHVRAFFDDNDRLLGTPLGTLSDEIAVRDASFAVKQRIPFPQLMTTWDAMYYRLRANFDAFASPYCPEPPASDDTEGEGVYENGMRVMRVDDTQADKLRVTAQSADGRTHVYPADFVIAADGPNSTIRRHLYPHIKADQPGYGLWRGTVSTKHVSSEMMDMLRGRVTLYQPSLGYMIIYEVPGDNGSLADGKRRLNLA